VSVPGVDERRVVQLVAHGRGLGGVARLGSGYLVGRGLVLTAAHVVQGAESITVRRVLGPGRLAEAGAQLVWADTGGVSDLAVLRVTAAGRRGAGFPEDLPPVGFGRVAGTVACEAVGFPLFKLRSTAPGSTPVVRAVYRDTHHARGMTTPLSNQYDGTLEITVDPPREDPDPMSSPWEGMSGAAVFADGLLVGVVCEHYRREGGHRITARRVESCYGLEAAALAALRAVIPLPRPGELVPVGVSSGGPALWRACPYLGLVPYRTQDAQVFYGRTEMTERLHRRIVIDHRAGSGLLVVSGPSGAGKSSLLNAGLVPALGKGAVLEQTATWPWVVMTPTWAPLRALAVALAEVTEYPVRALYDSLALDPRRVGRLVAEALARRADAQRGALEPERRPRLVLVVDQFEELFTRVPGDPEGRGEREAFIAALHALSTPLPEHPGVGAGVVVAAVRGDFVDRLLEFEPLAAAYEAGPFAVGPMTRAELRSAVTGPASEAGLTVEPELVETLVREAREQPDTLALAAGILPLVSQVMARVWEQCDGGPLTMRGYQRAGGLAQAVNRDATEAYRGLDEDSQRIARAVFLRLTLMAGEGPVTRRRARREELYRAVDGTHAAVDHLLEAFAARRLVVLQDDHVEIAHEALIQAWDTLQGWLDEDRGDHVVYARVAVDAESWLEHDENPDFLYQTARLGEIAEVQARWAADPGRYSSPSEPVTRFLAAGTAAETARRAAEKATVSRLRRRLIGVAVFALLTIFAAAGAGIAAGYARHDASILQQDSITALAGQFAAQALTLDTTEPYAARQLAAAMWEIAPNSTETELSTATLLTEQPNTLFTPDTAILSFAFNPAGTVLATAGQDGAVRLWNPTTEQQIGTTIDADSDSVYGVAFNPAGTVLATAGEDGAVRLWNPTTEQQIGTTIDADSDSVYGVAFNPAGTILATAGEDGSVRLWDPTTHQQIGTTVDAGSDSVYGVAFNPAGTILATADGNGSVRLWDPTTDQPIGTTIDADSDSVYGVAFNPAGTVLATAGEDGSVRLWDPTTHQQIGTTVDAGSDSVYGVAFNPAGTILATAGQDGSVRLWDPTTHQQIGTTIDADSHSVNGVAFNPAGTILATADGNGSARLWDPTTDQPIGTTIDADSHSVNGVAFNPAGTVLATAGQDGSVRLWNPTTDQQIGTTINADSYPASGVAFNPAGTILATEGEDGSVRLWDPTTDQPIGTTIDADSDSFNGVAFNPAGTKLATAGEDGSARLWNTTTDQPIGTTISTGSDSVNGVAFNPAGTVLATADGNGSVRLWDPATDQPIGTTINADSDSVNGVAFNPAGTVLATAGQDGAVRLWNTATDQQIGTTISTGNYPVNDVAFNPAGTILATAGGNGSVRLWNPTTDQQIGTTISTGNYPVNGVAFNPAGTILATADSDGSVTLTNMSWETNAGQLLCQSVGLPSKAFWSSYVRTALTEPRKCS
jgi:WD40 repeat protein